MKNMSNEQILNSVVNTYMVDGSEQAQEKLVKAIQKEDGYIIDLTPLKRCIQAEYNYVANISTTNKIEKCRNKLKMEILKDLWDLLLLAEESDRGEI